MKIVYVIDHLAVGGAQQQLLALVQGLPRDRYQPEVISLSVTENALGTEVEAAGVPLTRFDHQGAFSPRTLRALTRSFRASRPDVVHTWLFTADLYGRVAARLAGVPVVMSAVRSVEPEKPLRQVLADRALRRITHAFTVNARAVGEVLARREGVPWAHIHTVYNGLDLTAFRPQAAPPRGAPGPVLGIVGRLGPEKGHAVALRALAALRPDLPQARLVVVGRGPLDAPLRAMAAELGVSPQVEFRGAVRPVVGVYPELDALVVASDFEGCSNVILEAMAMARPVLATAVGGNPELVDPGRTGILFPRGDHAALARAIRELASDPQAAAEMGRRGRAMVEERFTLKRMVEETAALYERLADRTRAPTT